MDGDITDAAVRYLSGDRTQPFFLGVSLYNPHDICFWIMDQHHDALPCVPEDAALPDLPENFDSKPLESEFVSWLRLQDAVVGGNDPYVDPDCYWNELRWTDDWDELHWRRYLYVYDRLVELADIQVGRVLETIRDQELENNTLVILTSDHGEGIAGHRWVTKEMLYEEPVTVPLIIRWPGVIPSGSFDTVHLASSIDIAPTLYDYAAITDQGELPGRSLRSAIEDPETPNCQYIVAELQPAKERMELKGRMIRTPSYKYMAFSAGTHPEMFFDLDEDPLEMVNQARSETHQKVLLEHRELLDSWVKQTNDDFETASVQL